MVKLKGNICTLLKWVCLYLLILLYHSNSGGMLLCLQHSPLIGYQLHYLVIFLHFRNYLIIFLIIASSRCLDVHAFLTYVLITIISCSIDKLNTFFLVIVPITRVIGVSVPMVAYTLFAQSTLMNKSFHILSCFPLNLFSTTCLV